MILPETHLIKRLAGFLTCGSPKTPARNEANLRTTAAQEPMIAPRPSSYIQKPSLNGVTSNLHSLSVRHSQPYPPHSRIPRRATPPQQSLPPPPEQSATQSFIYSASPSSAPSIASFATYPPPSTRLDPPLRSSSYFTPLQQAFLASISHPSTPSASALRTSSAHRDREAQREQSRPYPRPSSQHSMHSPTTELNDHRSHSRPPSQYSSHSNSSSEYHDFPPEPRVLRPVNSTAEHYLWNAHLGLLYRLGADFDTRTSLDGQTVISFPPGSCRSFARALDQVDANLHLQTDHKVVKEDLEILPSDGKAINEWLRGVSLVSFATELGTDGLSLAARVRWVVSLPVREEASCDDSSPRRQLQSACSPIGRPDQAVVRTAKFGAEVISHGVDATLADDPGNGSSKSRGYQSSIMFIPGEGSGDWNDSQSLSDSASTHQVRPLFFFAKLESVLMHPADQARRGGRRSAVLRRANAAQDGIRQSSSLPGTRGGLTLFDDADAARWTFGARSSCSHHVVVVVVVVGMGCASSVLSNSARSR